jgi:hypothetical protein
MSGETVVCTCLDCSRDMEEGSVHLHMGLEHSESCDLYITPVARPSCFNWQHPTHRGRAIAEGFSRWLSTAAARVQSRVWSSGICGGQSGAGAGFFPSTSVSPAFHSTEFSILTITQGRHNRPVSGRRAEWTQFGLHPPLCKLKN